MERSWRRLRFGCHGNKELNASLTVTTFPCSVRIKVLILQLASLFIKLHGDANPRHQVSPSNRSPNHK